MRIHIPIVVALFGLLIAAAPSSSHEGHEHDKPPPLSLPIAPRVFAVTPDYELVGVLSGEKRLNIFFHSFATGEPVKDVKLSVTSSDTTTPAKRLSDGVYEVVADWIAKRGTHDITFNIVTPAGEDIMVGQFVRPEIEKAVVQQTGLFAKLGENKGPVIAALGAAMVGLLIGLLFAGRRREVSVTPAPPVIGGNSEAELEKTTEPLAQVKKLKRVGLTSALGFMLLVAGSLDHRAAAADGASPAIPEIPATMATDLPQRLPDGTLFVPKATQHLLSLRTVLTAAAEVPRSVELLGVVVASPSGLGRVQASQPGRLEAPLEGMPHLGRRVEKGDVLVTVTPTTTALDMSRYENEMVALNSEIEVAQKKYERLSKNTGVVRQRDIDEAKAQYDGLLQRRTNYSPALRVKEEIRAPLAGIISKTNVVPGQIVEARENLFEIVDPSEFWVEAIAYDLAAVETMTSAQAVTGSGDILPLHFIGRGFELRQQAIPMSFRVTKEVAGLGLGKPVTVVLQRSERVQGFVLPASSVVRGQGGLPVVWVKSEPERFEPHPVKFEKLDGQRVVISAGLKPDQRVVTDGVTLLNQIR